RRSSPVVTSLLSSVTAVPNEIIGHPASSRWQKRVLRLPAPAPILVPVILWRYPMAIMAVFDAPEMTKAQYDALRPVVNWEQQHPDGVILHSCAFDAQGGLHVVDLWESAEKLDMFFRDRLGPGFA